MEKRILMDQPETDNKEVTNSELSKLLDQLLVATIKETLKGVEKGDSKSLEIALKLLNGHRSNIPKTPEVLTSGDPEAILQGAEDDIRSKLPSRRNR